MNELTNKNSRSSTNFFNAWFVALDKRGRVFLESGRFRIFALLLLLLLLVGLLALLAVSGHASGALARFTQFIPWIAGAAAGLVLALAYTIWRELLEPLLHLCEWANQMRGVNLDATVELPARCDFAELASDINMLGRMIEQLSSETDEQLQKHTEYISRESRSLAILYDVAASISVSRDLGELFNKSLDSLCENLDVQVGLIRQWVNDEKPRVVASYGGIDKAFISKTNRLFQPVPAVGVKNEPSDYAFDTILRTELFESRDTAVTDKLSVVSVDIRYRDKTSGVINLFFSQDKKLESGVYRELLVSIGQHLGTAIEKYRLDEEESQLLVMRERTRLSHELHDSLAQTLASLRMQVRVLDEIFHSNDEPNIWQQLERVEDAIEQANIQVRELIGQFRVPMSRGGLISSIQEAIQSTRDETDMHIYFQNEWSVQGLPANLELQILRVVQECLANIRKHSRAGSARVLLRGHRVAEKYYLLIEDDGIGFDASRMESVDGQHLGLSILRDRAREIEGEITIDTEPGEGTRVTLQFAHPDSKS